MKKNLFLLAAVVTIAIFVLTPLAAFAADSTILCWFPPSWKIKGSNARAITEALSSTSGLDIKPRIAKSYPEILEAFSSEGNSLVYVGSFVQAIINARNLGTALVQSKNGKELYSGIMVYPEGGDPEAILKNSPDQIAFTLGASSGESSAKAATGGKASIGVANHGAASNAVIAGKAKAAVVKNWWWEANKAKFPVSPCMRFPVFQNRRIPTTCSPPRRRSRRISGKRYPRRLSPARMPSAPRRWKPSTRGPSSFPWNL